MSTIELDHINHNSLLQDKITGKSLTEVLNSWIFNLRLIEKFNTVYGMFYVAGSIDKTTQFVNDLAELCKVKESDVVVLELSKFGSLSLNLILEKEFERICADKGKIIIILANGFSSRYSQAMDTTRKNRLGHDWDQDVIESAKLKEMYRKVGKTVLIVTTIDFRDGEENYEGALKSALISQFKHGIVELPK